MVLVVESPSGVHAPLGARTLASVHLRSEDTGKAVDVHGPAPRGFAAFGADRRTTVLITDTGEALDRGHTAYTGRFAAEAGAAACHPAPEESEQHRLPETQGGEPTPPSLPQNRPLHPGRARRAASTRVRERRGDRATTKERPPGGGEELRS